MISQLIIPNVSPSCTGDGCQLPAKYSCAKCGALVCDVPHGLIGDEGRATATIRTFPTGHHVVCLFCRFTAQQSIYCGRCAGEHELGLNLRGSCQTMYKSIHESAYDDLTQRSSEDATEMADRRNQKYKQMDSNLPEVGGGRMIRSQEEQDEVVYVEEDEEGTIRIVDPRRLEDDESSGSGE